MSPSNKHHESILRAYNSHDPAEQVQLTLLRDHIQDFYFGRPSNLAKTWLLTRQCVDNWVRGRYAVDQWLRLWSPVKRKNMPTPACWSANGWVEFCGVAYQRRPKARSKLRELLNIEMF